MDNEIFVGRKKEIERLILSLDKKRSIHIIAGEIGIGKSALLQQFSSIVKNHNFSTNGLLIGFYDKDKALIGESHSLMYPFVVVLQDLLVNAKNDEKFNNKINSVLKRLYETFKQFAYQKGTEIAAAVLHDAFKKAGLDQTFEVLKEIHKIFKDQKTTISLAEDFVAQHKEEAIIGYVKIFQTLADESKDCKFVLIFDQFESAGKASIDFLVNFVARMPDNFHIIVSFKVEQEIWSDSIARELYQYTKSKLEALNAETIHLRGLSAEEIGEWIAIVRNVKLQLVPDLERIREKSVGFPMLLEAWIKQSEKLDYNNINTGRICEYILKRVEGLSDDDLARINKMAILTRPLEAKDLVEFLKMQLDHLQPFMDRLTKLWMFEKVDGNTWFKHELVKSCIESNLASDIQKLYHNHAADFYLKRLQGGQEQKIEDRDACAYHLHIAGRHKESLQYNRELAAIASRIGALDFAERYFIRAIKDAEMLHKEKERVYLLGGLTSEVYLTWGRLDDALQNYNEIMQYALNTKDLSLQSKALSSVAHLSSVKGDFNNALKLYDEALKICQKIGDEKDTANLLHDTAIVYAQTGDYDKALELCNNALHLSKKVEDEHGAATSLHQISTIYHLKGDYPRAVELYNESYTLWKKLGDRHRMAVSLHTMGIIHREFGNFDKATQLCSQALDLFRTVGDKRGIAVALHEIATICQIKHNYSQALQPYNESLEIKRQLLDQSGIATALSEIAMTYQSMGDNDKALEYYTSSLEIAKRIGDRRVAGIVSLNMGSLFIETSEHRKALPYSYYAYLIFKKLNLPNLREALHDLDLIKNVLRDEYDEALKNLKAEID